MTATRDPHGGTPAQTNTSESDWVLKFSARLNQLARIPPRRRMPLAHAAYLDAADLCPEEAAEIVALSYRPAEEPGAPE
jgi:hypothetical protein